MSAARRNGRFRVGAGSAVLFTEDGYLLTNAHVVAGTQRGHAVFADGSRMNWNWSEQTPCPILLSSTAGRLGYRRRNSVPRSRCGWASWWWPSATPWAWPVP